MQLGITSSTEVNLGITSEFSGDPKPEKPIREEVDFRMKCWAVRRPHTFEYIRLGITSSTEVNLGITSEFSGDPKPEKPIREEVDFRMKCWAVRRPHTFEYIRQAGRKQTQPLSSRSTCSTRSTNGEIHQGMTRVGGGTPSLEKKVTVLNDGFVSRRLPSAEKDRSPYCLVGAS
ncbi:hypothetical protein Tcan_13894 [Toxocara canis]|uniref:Uncharacterized protein n=1 Tax=Toxocara canis TaxID=6265 RepID=A0A0B2V339_TOXCA|nr:hypothetical protein Tcan_13894 [Toxocara canis]